MRTNAIMIFVTCASRAEALRITKRLLGQRLVACSNIISGLDSRFWWGGRIEKAKEFLVVLKTERRKFYRIEKEVKRLHSYDVPEIVAIPIVAGSKDYLEWIKEAIK